MNNLCDEFFRLCEEKPYKIFIKLLKKVRIVEKYDKESV